MKRSFPLTAAVALLSPVALLFSVVCVLAGRGPSDDRIALAFGKQGIRISLSEAAAIRDDVQIALKEAKANGLGSSKVDFAAVEIAQELGLDTGRGSNSGRTSSPPSGGCSRTATCRRRPPRRLPLPRPRRSRGRSTSATRRTSGTSPISCGWWAAGGSRR